MDLRRSPSQEQIPVPTLTITPRSNRTSQCWNSPKRATDSYRSPAINPRLASPTARLSDFSISRNPFSFKLSDTNSPNYRSPRYNISLKAMRLEMVGEDGDESQRSGGLLLGQDELMGIGNKLRPKRDKIERVERELQKLGSSNEQKAQHLEDLAEKIKSIYERLEKKERATILLEKKNNMIRSCVLTTKLERDIRREMKQNKEKWHKIFLNHELEPDFENHTWNRVKNRSLDNLIKRMSAIEKSEKGSKSRGAKSPTGKRRYKSSRRRGKGDDFWK